MISPGEFICNTEEFLPGDGTFEEEGKVYSSLTGEPQFHGENRVVCIVPKKKIPRKNVVNSIVYGRVIQVTDQFVIVELFPYTSRRFRLIPPNKFAAIHISKVKDGFVENLRDEFEVGDWVRAKISGIQHRFYIQLTTANENLGIIKAFCKKCRSPLVRKRGYLLCPKCKEKYNRKIAKDYAFPVIPGVIG